MSRDPLALAALAGMSGILAADHYSLKITWAACAVLVLALAAIYFRRNTLLLLALTATCFSFLHTLEIRWIDSFPNAEQLPAGSPASTDSGASPVMIEAVALVINEPKISSEKRGTSCLIRLESLIMGDRIYKTRHHARLRIDRLPNHLRDLSYGDTLAFNGHIYRLPSARNPGAFSPRVYYRRSEGAIAEIRCNTGHNLRRLSSGQGNPVIHLAHHSRDWLARAITRDIENDPQIASIITAMVLGAREDTPEAIEEQFRLSGALHIFAVSGLHIGLFGLIIWQLLKLLRVPRHIAVWIIIPAILFYAVVTGLRPSACRAALMGSIVLCSFLVERRPRLLNSLGLAALLLLAYDSQQLFLPGFQLSFAVLTSIAVLAPLFLSLFGRPFEIDPFLPRSLVPRFQRILSHSGSTACSYLSVSLAAWLGSLPLVIYHFQLVTPVSVLANCFLVPLAMLVLSLSILSLVSSLAQLGFLSVLFNNSNWLAAKTCSLLTAFFSSLPGAHFHYSFTPVPLSQSHPLYLAVLDTGDSGACHLLSTHRPDARPSKKTFSSDGRTSWLIDTGSLRSFPYTTHSFLRYRGINELDGLCLTHNDFQHVGGAPLLIPAYHPSQIFISPGLRFSRSMKDLKSSSAEQQAALIPLSSGEQLDLTSQLEIEVLYPPRNETSGPLADDNSLVLKIQAYGWRILLLGDAGFESEKWLLKNLPHKLASDLLIKGQHGTDLSGLKEFLLAVHPRAIVASNHHFPANEQITASWREMLRQSQIPLFDGRQCGAVEIRLGPQTLEVKGHVNDQELTLHKRKP